jgi:CheY-like chemotaxis protein
MSLPSELDQPRLLLVDDDPAFIRIVELVLQTRVDLQFVEDPNMALRTALTFRPDLVVCDMSMPGMSGTDVFALLQDEERTRHITFALITGYMDESEGPLERARSAGIKHIIRKDQDLASLMESILSLLSPDTE